MRAKRERGESGESGMDVGVAGVGDRLVERMVEIDWDAVECGDDGAISKIEVGANGYAVVDDECLTSSPSIFADPTPLPVVPLA